MFLEQLIYNFYGFIKKQKQSKTRQLFDFKHHKFLDENLEEQLKKINIGKHTIFNFLAYFLL
ncbi:hypothetical protein ADICYQ_0340 [Cyclobacterium qasimii M12-11B]|uniref:Uncharacterized protein n=1 Tax=Cyclobacterium qasimii M12-11B TaxID=641524 RepID=S7X5S9_9BACT|nr:hypothetical protein ADICYQ_0340 [Cyclobacterium qasimii M12-11B]